MAFKQYYKCVQGPKAKDSHSKWRDGEASKKNNYKERILEVKTTIPRKRNSLPEFYIVIYIMSFTSLTKSKVLVT